MFFWYCKNVKMISMYNMAYIIKRIKIYLQIFIISLFLFVKVKVWNKMEKMWRIPVCFILCYLFCLHILFLFLYFIYCTFILGLRLFCTYTLIMAHKFFFFYFSLLLCSQVITHELYPWSLLVWHQCFCNC